MKTPASASSSADAHDKSTPPWDTWETPGSLTAPEEEALSSSGRAGWLSGIVLGVLAGLLCFPLVRYTVIAHFMFALAQDDIPWVRVLDAQASARERPRLDVAAVAAPDDYLRQVGRATAFAGQGGALRGAVSPRALVRRDDDHTLMRLYMVVERFPAANGGYAHLARYLMADRVRILRAEIHAEDDAGTPTPRSIPPRHADLDLALWALQRGERRDPDNAFWPTLQAAALFSAGRDEQALASLGRAYRKRGWDSYIHEELLGQWRLYTAAYGDNGASQKIGPLSLVAFPHLREVRRMAEMARWHADRKERRGDTRGAYRIRSRLIWLGRLMREEATWAYEALYGTDVLLIGAMDASGTLLPAAIRSVGQWEEQSPRFRSLMVREGRGNDGYLRNEIQAGCRLKTQLDLARADASYPGIPPGIPLMALFGNWIVGVCLLQQGVSLAVATLFITLYRRVSRCSSWVGVFALAALLGATLGCGALLWFGSPTPRAGLGFFAGATILLVIVIDALARSSHASTARWSQGTSVRILALLLVPGFALLFWLRPGLSALHPVAVLLASMMGGQRPPSVWDAISLALLTCALPACLALIAAFWGVYRRVLPRDAVISAFSRLTLPTLACLALAYLLTLNVIISLDGEASRAINAAARNDLQWVLTHSAAGDEE